VFFLSRKTSHRIVDHSLQAGRRCDKVKVQTDSDTSVVVGIDLTLAGTGGWNRVARSETDEAVAIIGLYAEQEERAETEYAGNLRTDRTAHVIWAELT
jgi:hypothetical protein